MTIKGYDAWRLSTPWDDDADPCECGEDVCDCIEEYELDRGDYLHEKWRDREMEKQNDNLPRLA